MPVTWHKLPELIKLAFHHTRHEDGGDDEISVDGLSGLLADDQHVLSNEIDYGLSFEGIVTTYTDTTHFKVSTLAGKGTGAFKPASGTPYEIFVFQADGAAPEGQQTPVVAYTSSDGTFQHAAFTSGNLAVGDIVLIIHPLLASLGTKATAAATGAVTTTGFMMAYLKQLVTGLALDGSAPHSYDYTKATVPGWLHGFHMIRRILFVIPEAVGSITAHNTAIKAELDKMGLVITITQADALTYPDYESITLTVLGSPLAGTAWTTSNLAHIKAIFGLPIVCVDGGAAAYLQMGVDGGNAATKTVLNAISNIEGSILGAGIDDTTGLAAGANTVAASGVTFSTLDMSDTDITEIWYAWETTEDNTDVLLSEIRKTMPDGTPGVDADGADIPGTLAFYGCAYSMDGLNTLGKAVFHLFVEKLLHSSTSGLAVILSGNVGNVVATLGTKATPAATGAVSNAKKMMGYVKQLVTLLIAQDIVIDNIHDTDLPAVKTVVDAIQAITDALPDAGALTTLQAAVDAIPTVMVGTDGAALASAWTATLATALGNYNATRAGYLDQLDFALQEAIAALPTTAMRGTDNAATEAKQDIIDTNVDDIEADTSDMQPKLGTPAADISADIAAIKAVVDAITGVQLSTDWKGNFNWDTSAYTTNEQDISALFSTNLALTTRRKYSVKLDLTAVEADGSFDELYLAVKEKIDGTNYRAIDRKTVTKANIATVAEPGIIIDIPASSENVQITMQMKTALAGDATIYYSVVKEHLE